MQLVSSKQYLVSSNEYHILPGLIEQFESGTEVYSIRKSPGFVSIPPEEITRQSEVESSLFLKLQKTIEQLEDFYTLENAVDVKKFLWTHERLIDILSEAHRRIKKIFGEVANLSLELHHDPEEDFEGLFIIIKTNLSPEESLDLLDKFDEEWWLDVDDEVRKILEVDIENIFEVTVRPI